MIQLSRKKDRIAIDLTAYPIGEDLCVVITGGDVPHLGALTAASRLEEPKTIAFGTHKEFHVTQMAAGHLREKIDGNFVVCSGIHLDNIKKQEISEVMALCEEMVLELCDRLKSGIGA